MAAAVSRWLRANGGSLKFTVHSVPKPDFSQTGLNSGGGGGMSVDGSTETGCPAHTDCDW